MSRITKTQCEEISKAMTMKMTEEMRSIQNQINLIFEKYIRSKIPNEVMEMFKKYPHLFSTRKYFHLNNTNLKIEISGAVPYSNNESGWVSELDKEIETKILSLWKTYRNIEDKRYELRRKIETALYDLRTYKKITELLPEAVPFIKANENEQLLPSIPIIQIRQELSEINNTTV